jgi:hypothetical protein
MMKRLPINVELHSPRVAMLAHLPIPAIAAGNDAEIYRSEPIATTGRDGKEFILLVSRPG